ncbi:MAG: BrnT family toxin [Sneathiellales bacterium]|nr:BrnT family toxin [Sneathiellales bacterium]
MFEWDEEKSQQCLVERGFDFSIIAGFDFQTALIAEDTRKDYGERRFRAFGFIGKDLFAVAFTPRGQHLRVISIRRMHRKEGVRYGLID